MASVRRFSFAVPSSTVERFMTVARSQIAATSYTGISATNDSGFPEPDVPLLPQRGPDFCRRRARAECRDPPIANNRWSCEDAARGRAIGFAFSAKKGYQLRIGSSFVKGWFAGTSELGTPPNYKDWLAPSYNLATIRYRLNEGDYDLAGIYLDIGENNPLLSPHPGVVNILYCDSSVHVIRDSIEVPILKSLATPVTDLMYPHRLKCQVSSDSRRGNPLGISGDFWARRRLDTQL